MRDLPSSSRFHARKTLYCCGAKIAKASTSSVVASFTVMVRSRVKPRVPDGVLRSIDAGIADWPATKPLHGLGWLRRSTQAGSAIAERIDWIAHAGQTQSVRWRGGASC
jgi:hypothetical protein